MTQCLRIIKRLEIKPFFYISIRECKDFKLKNGKGKAISLKLKIVFFISPTKKITPWRDFYIKHNKKTAVNKATPCN